MSSIFNLAIRRLGLVALVILSTAEFSNVLAADSKSQEFFAAHGRFLSLYRNELSDISLDYQLENSRESEDSNLSYDLETISFEAELLSPLTRDLFYRVGIGYEYRDYQFDFSDSSEFVDSDFGMRLHYPRARGGLGLFIGDSLLLTGFFDVGFASDFEDGVTSEAHTEEFDARMIYEIHPGAQLLVGVRKGYEFEKINLYPLLGFRLIDTEGKLRLSLTLPIEAKIQYRAFDWLDLYSLANLSGREYQLGFAPGEQTGSLKVIERRLAIGMQLLPGSLFVIQLEAGAGLDDSLEFELQNSTTSKQRAIDVGAYVSVGIGLSL